MLRRRLSPTVLLVLAGACSGDPGGPIPETPTGPAQASEVVFQAVDAGTGAALTDAQLHVRYLVRSPITVDAIGSESVPSSEPYHVSESVATDSLVLEIRLEAASYHRMDTVLSVARGGSAGPFTLRMARRLERTASARPSGPGARPTRPPDAGNRRPAAPPPDPDAGLDRSALQEGDRAFRSGSWFDAAAAYARMPAPTGTGDYARAYQQGMVNRGISHINLGELGAAMEALEAATAIEVPNAGAYRNLAHVQCSVGRVDEGLDTVDELEDVARELPAAQRPTALAFAKYEEGLCRKRTFDRTEGTLNLVSAGRSVISALEDFVEEGGAIGSPTPDLTAALADANRLLDEIRARMRRGGQ